MLYSYCKNPVKFFVRSSQKHSLKLKTKKTELIIFSEKHQARNHNSKFSMKLDDNKVEIKQEENLKIY